MSASVSLGSQNGTFIALNINRSNLSSFLMQQGINLCATGVYLLVSHFFRNASPLVRGAVTAVTVYGMATMIQYNRSKAQRAALQLKIAEEKFANYFKRTLESTNKLAKSLLKSDVLKPETEKGLLRLKGMLPAENATTTQIIQHAGCIVEFNKQTGKAALEAINYLKTEKEGLIENKRSLITEVQMLRDSVKDLEQRCLVVERQLREAEADIVTRQNQLMQFTQKG